MSLTAWCPRCRVDPATAVDEGDCPQHGARPPLWLPDEVSYEDFAEHLRLAGDFPTYLPWPLGPGWSVTEFGVVTRPTGTTGPTGTGQDRGRGVATLTCSSGTSALDGPVDVFVVSEEAGVGLGARCAGLLHDDPGADIGDGPPTVKVRVGSQSVALWPVSTSHSFPELDRSVFAGEAQGRWLWIVLRPASAMLLLRDDWILRDVSGAGPQLLEVPFGGQRPVW
ncbi:DUF6758 family protein [Nocardioides sp. GCM10027113]|uniref:DUF6758 family protein n=1 Tax=unclassified Nocardioides TaxID=2615069 RepID=UPI00361D5072